MVCTLHNFSLEHSLPDQERTCKIFLNYEVGDGHIYKGVTLTRMPNDLNAFIRDKQRMITTVIQFLNSRFESLDSDPVLAAGKIFYPRV